MLKSNQNKSKIKFCKHEKKIAVILHVIRVFMNALHLLSELYLYVYTAKLLIISIQVVQRITPKLNLSQKRQFIHNMSELPQGKYE